ncbi:15987_t:CDS:10, partial [Racocetra fulgida]
TGFMLWEKKIKPAGLGRTNSRGDEIYAQKVDVVFTMDNMGVVVLVGGYTISPKSYSIEVLTFDVQTGVLKSTSLSSQIGNIKDTIVVGGRSNSGFIVWKEGQYIRVNRLGSDSIEQSSLEASTSVYSGALDKSERLIVSRIIIVSKDLVKVEIFAPAHRLALGSHEISYSMAASGGITKSLLDVTTKKNSQTTAVAYRMLVTSDDGSVHFFKEDSIAWNKEESLSHAIEVEFLDLPEKKLWTQEVDELVALDTSNKGQIVWSRYFGGIVSEFQKIFVVRSSTVKYPPVVVAIGIQKKTDKSNITCLFRLNALTGEDFITDHEIYTPTDNNISFSIPTVARRIFKLPVEEPDERTHIIALLDEDLKARLISLKAFQKFAASFYFALSDGIGSKSLKGYSVAIDKVSQPFNINRLWELNFPEGNNIVAIGHRPSHDQVFGLPKRFLDPRRPQRALTNEDKEEMLIPYEPAISDNKKFILSYNLPIYGIRHITTSPALLESTSLVLAYGLDLWFTREAPSKTFDVLSEDFSKGTLLATILGLVIGILVTKPS